MQATSTKRFVRSRAGGMVAAFGVLLIGVVAIVAFALISTDSQEATSVVVPASDSSVPQNDQIIIKPDLWKTPYVAPSRSYEEIKLLEENLWQIPYDAPPPVSYEEMRFIEDNTTFQTPYSMPALSHDEIRLWTGASVYDSGF